VVGFVGRRYCCVDRGRTRTSTHNAHEVTILETSGPLSFTWRDPEVSWQMLLRGQGKVTPTRTTRVTSDRSRKSGRTLIVWYYYFLLSSFFLSVVFGRRLRRGPSAHSFAMFHAPQKVLATRTKGACKINSRQASSILLNYAGMGWSFFPHMKSHTPIAYTHHIANIGALFALCKTLPTHHPANHFYHGYIVIFLVVHA
jgi:hypothetical protein